MRSAAGRLGSISVKMIRAILSAGCVVGLSQRALAFQPTPEDLARLWIEAIAANSAEKIRPLIHPACPQNSISPDTLARMVQGRLPQTYDIETRELGPRAELEKVYQVVPDRQLTIKYRTTTPEEKAKYGLGKGFPIAQASGQWFFVICPKSE